MSYIGFAAQFPGMCFAAWNTFCQNQRRSSSSPVRFIVAMVIELAVLLFTVAFTMVDTSHIPGTFFALTIASVVLINCCVGVHQTLTFGMAAVLPMKYSNAVIVGSSACGTIISMVNIITKLLSSVNGRTTRSIVGGAVAYFLSSVTIVIACLVTFFWLKRLPFVLYYVGLSNRCLEVIPSDLVDESLSTLKIQTSPQSSSRSTVRSDRNSPTRQLSTRSQDVTFDPAERESLLAMETDPRNDSRRPNTGYFKSCCRSSYWSRYTVTLAECWPQCLNVWSVFFCSLSIFPAIQSMVKPTNPNYFISPDWFADVTCFLFFNLFAMLGCISCNWIQYPGPRYLWIPVWIRTVFFIPFFLFCQFNLVEPKLPVLIVNDHLYVFAVIIFAFSNGFLSSLAMMYAPRSCPPERAELAGMMAAFFLIVGVCSGVYASRGFVSLII